MHIRNERTWYAIEPLENRRMLASVSVVTSLSGARSGSALISDAAGNIYGTTKNGGSSGYGSVFKLGRGATAITTIASFKGTNGSAPLGLTIDGAGNLFGTTYQGTTSATAGGTIFEIAAGTSTITTLATFVGYNGIYPCGRLEIDANGTLYGATSAGGDINGDGTLFKLPAGATAVTTIALFNGTNGGQPQGGVTLGTDGTLYGTTAGGGTGGNGTVFKVAPGSTTITTIARFGYGNGSGPYSPILRDLAGNLYGTTIHGGPNGASSGYGTAFEIAAGTSTITTIANFGLSGGNDPVAGLTMDGSGNLFGVTSYGGTGNYGTVFEVGASTTPTTVAAFDANSGSNASTELMLDSSGRLLGTTNTAIYQVSGSPFVPLDGDDQLSEATTLGAMTQTRFIASQTSSKTPVLSTIDRATDVDMYSLTVAAGQRIGLDVDLLSGGLDPYLRLFNASGTQLASNDDGAAWGEAPGGLEAFIDYTFSAGGTYYVGVSASGNSAYDPVSGNNDAAGASTGSYVLIASPGLTGTISGDVGLGPQTFVVDILASGNASPMPITTSNAENWMVIHGRVSSRDTTSPPNFPRLIADIGASRPLAQVMSLDWSGPANAIGSPSDLRQEDWIQPVAIWAAVALQAYGLNGPSMNLVGHSWGANVADELAERLTGGVNTTLAIDPAADGPNILGIGGVYNPDIDVNFAAHSKYSWGFFSRDGSFPTYGNPVTSATADEAFVVTGSEHSKLVNCVSWMLENPNTGAAPYFALSRLLQHQPGPWLLDSYPASGVRQWAAQAFTSGPFDAVIKASSDGQQLGYTPQYVSPDYHGALSTGSATVELGSAGSYSSVTIAQNGRLIADATGTRTVRTAQLSIAAGGVLDLNDAALILDSTDPSLMSTVAAWITSARNGGDWNGATGITSSIAASTPGDELGYAPAQAIYATFPATIGDESINASSLIVRLTRSGDANLDGTVNTPDFTAIGANFNASNATYSQGDFNYDGKVNALDFNILATNFGGSLASATASPMGESTANAARVAASSLPSLFASTAIDPEKLLIADLGDAEQNASVLAVQ